MGEERKVYKVLVRKPDEKRPLGRRGVDEWMGSEWRYTEGVEWIHWLRIGTGGGLL
jgi:hypothetical protein